MPLNTKHVVSRMVLAAVIVALGPLSHAESVNIYSARHYDTDMNLYDEFTRRTGIEVNLIEGGSDALIERIVNEGEYTPADLLITVDAGRLWRAQERGIFQPLESEVLTTKIPANLREPGGHWFGLSKRARVIAINKANPPAKPITRYEDLTDPSLKGKVCMRSSSNIYNLSLLASMIESQGSEAAAAWASGVAANFARSPQSNDTGNLTAVASGECGVTIGNTYYLGRWLVEGSANAKLFEAIEVIFPNQDDRGTHVNISGAGVVKHAPNPENAKKFLEYLVSDYAQRLFAEGNNEYPVVGATTGPIAQLGEFVEDNVNAGTLGVNQAEAVQLYDRAGWQ